MNRQDSYELIYDIRTHTSAPFGSPSFALVLLIVLITAVVVTRKSTNEKTAKVLSFLKPFFCVLTMVSMIIVAGPSIEYFWLSRMLANNDCEITEGDVENLHRDSVHEGFKVNAVDFGYNEIANTQAFHKTGLLQEKSFVRICFARQSHAILRLEVRR